MMCGGGFCTLYISESIERVVYNLPGGIEKIQYKNKFYSLQPAEKMTEIVKQHLADKGGVNLSGKTLYSFEKDQPFDPYPFIDITDADDRARYPLLRAKWLKSDEFKRA